MARFKGMETLGKGVKPFLQFMWAPEALRGRAASLLAKQGLTTSRFGVLDALRYLGPSSQKDLGKGIFKSRGNITKVVYDLERDGLVKRERDDSDRRCCRVTLASRGRRIFEKALPLHVGQIEKEMAGLTEKERGDFSRLCAKLGRGGDETESRPSTARTTGVPRQKGAERRRGE